MVSRILSILLVCSPTLLAQAPTLDALKKEALAATDKQEKLVQEIVDSVFSFAELGFQEYETSRYLTAVLEKHGFKVERGVAGMPTAWIASWSNRGPKPVITFITDIDCIPRASQKPGVAYHDPIIENAPGHGEGHNSGMAVNIAAMIVLKDLMAKYNIPGTLKLIPGVAEELVATKAFFIRAGLFKDADIVLGVHVSSDFATNYGVAANNSGLVSIQYTFKGEAAHAAGAPWRGKSALDAVELMNAGWNYRREHLRPQQRSHYVIVNGGEQPNVVPDEATVWYYFRELDYLHIKEMQETGDTIAKAAGMMTNTTLSKRIVGSAWPTYFNKPIAEAQQKNIELVGMPEWSEADQKLATALQREINAPERGGLKTKVEALKEPPKDDESRRGGGTDDVGDISWVAPMTYMRYPANVPGLPGHHWANAIAMATPIAHKGSLAGAKVQALTALDYLTQPAMIEDAWKFFREVQTKDQKYVPLISDTDEPAIEMNKDKMDRFRDRMKTFYYDPSKHSTYLEQLGIQYPTVK